MADSKSSLVPGLVLATAIAIASDYIHALPFPPFTVGGKHPVDAILIAIVLGMATRNLLTLPTWTKPGIAYAVKSVLPIAIVLMGAKLDFFDVMRVSGLALVINVLCVTAALVLTVWLCMRARVSRNLGILIGAGTAICGGTAIAVTAPIIEADDNETAFAVTAITLFGLLWIPVFPLVGAALELGQVQFGIWAGTAIHATPQVMAAAFAFGDEAGEIAVIVKLVRVLLLAPVVIVIGALHAREKRRREQAHVTPAAKLTTLFPPFILGFLALALAKTLHLLPDFTFHLEQSFLWDAGSVDMSMSQLVTRASAFLVAVAMAGVGLGVHIRGLLKIGLRAFWVGLVSAVLLAVFSLVLIGVLS